MPRKFMITSVALLFIIIVSCDQRSLLGYTEQVTEPYSETNSTDPNYLSESLQRTENASSSELHRHQEEEDLPAKTRSGFNPKNGYTVETDSTGFSVEP